MRKFSWLLALASLISFLSITAASARLYADIIQLANVGSGDYRWLDVNDQAYSSTYRSAYSYNQATVQVAWNHTGATFSGTVTASNLKPNFAYQLKLSGWAGTDSNEKLGQAGRYWEETWNGSAWSNGTNLNDKGAGYAPSPNDATYLARRDVLDASSPTGKHYRYSAYLVLDYFLTDSSGNAAENFQTGSSYHVLWKTSQRSRTSDDGPAKSILFDPNLGDLGYDANYPSSTVAIFGEWERLPMGNVPLAMGDYACTLFLTEESFHGSGGTYAGTWAAAMQGDVSFSIVPEPATLFLVATGLFGLTGLPFRRRFSR